jgi:glycosyltransferase involved in cell wall biosynthesis
LKRGESGGITVVMPAYREEANLVGTVEDMVTTLEAAGEPHRVIVVNDGSDDGTAEEAELLAARYPGRVLVVHHLVNRGYGAAMRTGIATALDRTDSAWIFLTDSDGQFRAAQIPWFLDVAADERADAVIGYRPHRADPAIRKVNAWLWTLASRVLLGVRSRDVDCAYKLIDRRFLEDLELHGNAALISPELLMKIRARGARIVQRPVDHLPRKHGEPSGAKLSVILRSVVGLFGLWRERATLPETQLDTPTPHRAGARQF